MSEVESKAAPRGRRRLRLMATLGIPVAVIAWLFFFWGVERKSWREEVKLVDGSTIEVQRRWTAKKIYYEIAHTGMKPTFQQVRLPDGTSFETKDQLYLLHLEKGTAAAQWTLIASTGACETFDKYGRPKPDYLQFDYVRGQWAYRAVQPEFFGRTSNLLISAAHASQGSYVSHRDKAMIYNSVHKGSGYFNIDPKFSSLCQQPTSGAQDISPHIRRRNR